ncbi:MAG: hypothetical protein HZB56_14845 [Deltaproteobacteria bacterium]|nr:hypothetical protein [Deltaproteobacteria bacterium]
MKSPVPGIEGREVGVLVPPGFHPRSRWPIPALYLLDGNNGLDYDPFGHGGWQAHRAADALAAAGAPLLLVLVPNAPARGEEFVPGKGRAPGPTAEGHLEFLARAVVPAVERRFPALVAPSGRVIAGSSYGGVHAFWAAWTRPDLFGMALAMSPSRAYDLSALVRRADAHPPLRIYLDSGTTDQHGGDDGLSRTRALARLLASRGYGEKDLRFVVGKGHSHTEAAWRERLPAAMRFLFLGR